MSSGTDASAVFSAVHDCCSCASVAASVSCEVPAPRQQHTSEPAPLMITANCRANDLLRTVLGNTHDHISRGTRPFGAVCDATDETGTPTLVAIGASC